MASNDVQFVIRVRDETAQTIKRFESNVIRTVGAITAAFASFRFTLFPIQAAADFERELKNVQKTTGFTDEEINQLSSSLITLSTQLGTSATDLAKISAIAGQLGLGRQGKASVEAFTASVAKAAVTLDLSVEKTAEFGAQLANVFNVPVGNVEKIFSLLNEISNNSVATANELADIMKRIGNTANLTITQVAALAGYARELGVPVEQAGTTFVNAFINLQTKVAVITKLLRISAEEWGQIIRDDPLRALTLVAAEINKITEQSRQATIIDELFGSGRQFSALQKVVADAGNEFGRLYDLVDKGSVAFLTGQSSIKEYNNIMEALVKQFDRLKQAFNNLAIRAGQGAINPLVQSFRTLIETLESPAALNAAEKLANFLADIVIGAVDLINSLNEVAPSMDTVIALFKFFVALKAADIFLAIVTKIKPLAAALLGLTAPLRTWIAELFRVPTAAQLAFSGATASAETFNAAVLRIAKAVAAALIELRAAMTALGETMVIVAAMAQKSAALAEAAAVQATIAAAAAVAAAEAAGATVLVEGVAGGAAAANAAAATATATAAATQQAKAFAEASEKAAKAGKASVLTAVQMTAALGASTQKAGLLARMLEGIRGIGGKIGKLFSFIGRGLLGIITGNLATIIALIAISFPEQTAAAFKKVWGIIVAGFRGVLRVIEYFLGPVFGGIGGNAAEVEANEKRKQEAIKKTVTAYDEYVKKIEALSDKEGTAKGDILDLFTKSQEQFDEGFRKILDDIATTAGAIANYRKGYAAQLNVFTDIVGKVSIAETKIQQLQAKIKEFQEQLATPAAQRTGLAASLSTEEIEEEIRAANNEIEAQRTILQELSTEYTTADTKLKQYAQTLETARQKAASPAFKQQVETLIDSNVRSILEAASVLNNLRKQQEAVQNELQKVEQSINEIEKGSNAPRSDADTARLTRQRELRQLEAEITAEQQRQSTYVEQQLNLLGASSAQLKLIQQYMGGQNNELEDMLALLQAAERIKFAENLLLLKDIQKVKAELEASISSREQAFVNAQRANAAPEVIQQLGEALQERKDAIARLNEQERIQLQIVQDIGREYDKNSATAQEFANYQAQSADQLRGTLEDLRKVDLGLTVQQGNSLATAFAKSEKTIKAITDYVAFKGINADIKEATRAIDAFVAKAKGAFDNTFVEISYLRESFLDFINELTGKKVELGIQFKLDDKTRELDAKIKKMQDEISKRYDKLIAKATTQSRKDYLEEQKKKELELLEIRKRNEQADLKQDALRKQINTKLKEARDYMQQAGEADSIDEAFTFKDAAKQSLKDAQKLILEAQGLSKTDIFGKTTVPKFSTTEIDRFAQTVGDINKDLISGVKEINDSWQKRAEATRDAFSKATEPVKAAFEAAENTVTKLKAVFPQLEGLINALSNNRTFAGELGAAADKYVAAMKTLQQQAGTSVLTAPEVEKFQGFFQDYSNQFASALGDALKRELEVTPSRGAATYATEALKDVFKGQNLGIDWSAIKGKLEDDSKKSRATVQADVEVNSVKPKDGGDGGGVTLPGTFQATLIEMGENTPPLQGEYKVTKFITDGVSVPTGAAQARASGGLITGPGTGTSDSILSWLSNGEYVMDALTTRFFGSGFFKTLQILARSGRKVLPAFASGGPVVNTSSNSVASTVANAMDIVNLNITLQGERVSLLGERQQVRNFVNLMKTMQAV